MRVESTSKKCQDAEIEKTGRKQHFSRYYGVIYTKIIEQLWYFDRLFIYYSFKTAPDAMNSDEHVYLVLFSRVEGENAMTVFLAGGGGGEDFQRARILKTCFLIYF